MNFVSLIDAALAEPASSGWRNWQQLFLTLGWRAELKGVEDASSLCLIAGGESQILVTNSKLYAHAVSLGYSNEAPLTLAWTENELHLSRTEIWRSIPGDSSLVVASSADDVAIRQLLFAVARERFTSLLDAPQKGDPHRRLAGELANAFARLRDRVSESADDRLDESDVFHLFHQLLFIRFHEDRFGPISDAGTISNVLTREVPVGSLTSLLADYRLQFNSELFGTEVAVARMPADSVLAVAKAMVEPWDRLKLNFSVAHSDVAGRLYQSFLANTPTLEREGRLFPVAYRIDRQRERGAFYTPQAVAQLIAERTIGDLIRKRKLTKLNEFRVLDPACGSGSFLLAAFRVLAAHFADLFGRTLTETERLDILTQSLFGGDDDETAVSLTRIQLLEEAAVDKSRLPTLGNNIARFDLLGDSNAIKPIGWEWVLDAGGFDAIISNPPFHNPLGATRAGVDTKMLRKRFHSAYGTGWNLAAVFLEASLPLLSDTGQVSMLLPQSVLDGPSGEALRYLVGSARVAEVIDFGRNELFAPTMTYVASLSINRRSNESPANLIRVTVARESISSVLDAVPGRNTVGREGVEITGSFSEDANQATLDETDSWSPFLVRWKRIQAECIHSETSNFDDPGCPQVVIGTQTGDDTRFTLDETRWSVNGDEIVVDGKYTIPLKFAPRWLRGSELRPFVVDRLCKRVVVPLVGEDPRVDRLIEHLGGVPASFRPGNLEKLRSPKVVVRRMFDEPAAVADPTGEWMIPQGGAGVIAVVSHRKSDIELMEALLNSALYQWLLEGLGHPKSNGYVQLMRHHWKAIPWTRLKTIERKLVIDAARKVKTALRDRTDNRVSCYWMARVALDEAVYDALRVDSQLREIVSVELWRRP